MKKKQKKVLVRIIVTVILLAAIIIVERTGVLSKASEPVRFLVLLGGYLLIYFIIGYDILWKALRGILNGRVFDENFLMAVATVGAFALAIYEKSGEYTEAVAVMLFYQTGELFQSIAVGKSRKNISELMDIRPDYANLCKEDQTVERVSPDTVEIGSVIVVNPGEKIPIDGIIESGFATIDTSALTGESMPRKVDEDSEVISGCINLDGVIKIRTTKSFGESTVSKILKLMESSGSKKANSEEFIHKFALKYTPAVCITALLLGLGIPIVRMFISLSPEWNIWIYRALTFLVISCPCALVISIPLTFFSGIGGASAKGILIKGSNYIETLSKTETVVMDKTGTLTKGSFEVCEVEVIGNEYTKEEMTHLAAYAENASSHPIALSLKKYYDQKIDLSKIGEVSEISGKGICAEVEGHRVCVGNLALMKAENAEYPQGVENISGVHVAVDGKYIGFFVIADAIKDNAKTAIAALGEIGISKTVMLTGDNSTVAQKVANELGISKVFWELLPQDKVEWVEKLLLEKSSGGSLAFVGDGINDAPVLGRADIGIAMGALGSDAAIEAADVVLMDDDPVKIALAVKIARKCMRIVYQNIVFALAIKAICLVLGALGIANMWIAVFADVGVMIIAVLNSIRALKQ